MSCSSRDVFSIELPNENVEVMALETDVRMRERHYTHAQFQLREEAGKLLQENYNDNGLAFVNVNRERAHRMVVPQEALSFETSLDDITVAEIELLDARKVLDQQSVEKAFKDVSADEIVEFLLEKRHDPNGVIQGYEFIQEGDAEITATTSWFFESGVPEDEEEGLGSADLDPFGIGTGIARQLGMAQELGAYTFNFNGDTILEAMNEVMDSFGLNWWVGEDGIVYIGPDGSRGQVLASQSGNNNIALARYTVTQDGKTTDRVQLHGSVKSLLSHRHGKTPGYIDTSARVIATANATEFDGKIVVEETSKPFDSLSDLELMASRQLYREIMGDAAGSAEINGLASSDTDALRDLDVGDYFYAGEGIEADCNEDVITGLFLVTSVQHRSDENTGWHITIELSLIPSLDNLETRSVVYDPDEDKEYDSLGAYITETTDQSDFPGAT